MNKRQRRMVWRDKEVQSLYRGVLLALVLLAAIVLAGIHDQADYTTACVSASACVELGR